MIDKLIRFFTSLFLFLLPVYFLPFPNSPVESDKQALFIFFALLLSATYAVKVFKERKLAFGKTPVDLLLLFWATAYIVSTLIVSPNKIGAFSVPLGTGTVIATVLLYLVLSRKTVNLFPLVFSSLLVSLLTIANQFKIATNLNPAGDVLSTFIFLAVITIYLAGKLLTSFKKDLSSVAHLLIFLAVLSTEVILVYHLATNAKPLLLPFTYGWAIMMESFKSFGNFLLGIGPANFLFAYSLGKPVGINQTPFWNLAVNSSSSYFLTLATEAGIISALFFALTAFKSLKSPPGQHAQNKPYIFALFTAWLALFLLPADTLLLAAAVIFLAAAATSAKPREKTLPPWASYFLGAFLISLAVFAFWEGKVYLANIYIRKSITEANTGKNLANAYRYAQMAISSDNHNESYYGLSANLALALAQNLAQNPNASDSAKSISSLTQQAVNDARAATSLNSLNPQNWELLASVYQALTGTVKDAGQMALSAYDRQITLDPNNPMPKVAAAGILLSSLASQGETLRTQSTQSAQLLDQARALLVQAINLKPDWNSARYNMAVYFRLTGRYADANAEMQKALDLTPSDTQDYKKIQSELERLKTLLPKESTPSSVSSLRSHLEYSR